jgi:hypothetical protein
MSNDFDKFNAASSGYLLSRWLPASTGRKILLFVLIVFGAFGIYNNGHWYHYVAIVIAASMSPRLMGETAYFLGKVKRFFSIFSKK